MPAKRKPKPTPHPSIVILDMRTMSAILLRVCIEVTWRKDGTYEREATAMVIAG
jgi:hypothetical protein